MTSGTTNFWDTSRPEQLEFDPLLRRIVSGEPGLELTGGAPAIEKVLETFIALEFESVTGFQPVAAAVSRALRSEADVVALDELGRVHLVEVKPDKISEADVEQATQYMLRYVFSDRLAALGEGISDYDVRQHEIAVTLAAVAAGYDATKVGFKNYRHEVANDPSLLDYAKNQLGRSPTESSWATDRQTVAGARLHIAWMLASARRHGFFASVSHEAAVESALAAAEARSTSLWAPRNMESMAGLPRPKRALILWLAAPRVSDKALQKLTALRAVGIDVRVVEIDMRRQRVADPAGNQGWSVRIRRESAPARDVVEAEAIAAARQGKIAAARISAHFYMEKPPSARDVSPLYGQQLDFPDIRLPDMAGISQGFGALLDNWLQATAEQLGVGAVELVSTVKVWTARAAQYPWIAARKQSTWLHESYRAAGNTTGAEGKYGVALNRPWRPGFFVGVLWHGADHSVGPVDKNKGVDVVCFLEVEHKLLGDDPAARHASLRESGKCGAFHGLVQALRSDPRVVAGGWHVHSASDQRLPNFHHPLALRRPLVDVLAGQQLNSETAYANWVTALEESLLLLVGQPWLEVLVEQLQRR